MAGWSRCRRASRSLELLRSSASMRRSMALQEPTQAVFATFTEPHTERFRSRSVRLARLVFPALRLLRTLSRAEITRGAWSQKGHSQRRPGRGSEPGQTLQSRSFAFRHLMRLWLPASDSRSASGLRRKAVRFRWGSMTRLADRQSPRPTNYIRGSLSSCKMSRARREQRSRSLLALRPLRRTTRTQPGEPPRDFQPTPIRRFSSFRTPSTPCSTIARCAMDLRGIPNRWSAFGTLGRILTGLLACGSLRTPLPRRSDGTCSERTLISITGISSASNTPRIQHSRVGKTRRDE